MLSFPIVCASVWCAVSIEMVWETARTDGRALVLFGHVVAAPPVSATIVIVCAVSAAAALAMAIAVGYARGRRLERRMAAELDARWAELAERDARPRLDLLRALGRAWTGPRLWAYASPARR